MLDMMMIVQMRSAITDVFLCVNSNIRVGFFLLKPVSKQHDVSYFAKRTDNV